MKIDAQDTAKLNVKGIRNFHCLPWGMTTRNISVAAILGAIAGLVDP